MRLGVSLCGAAGEDEEEGEGRRRGGRLFFPLAEREGGERGQLSDGEG